MKDDFMDKIFEEVIKEGALEYTQNVENEKNEKITFSKEHEAKMEKLFKKQKKDELLSKYAYITRKVAIVLIASIIVFGGLVFTVEAIKKEVSTFKMEEHGSDYISIKFNEDDESLNESSEEGANTYITENVQFLYLPEGFECVNSTKYETAEYYKFYDKKLDNGKYVWLYVNNRENYKFDTDIENSHSEKIDIGDKSVFKRAKSDEILDYVWSDSVYYYELNSCLSEEETLKIIEKIKILKKN